MQKHQDELPPLELLRDASVPEELIDVIGRLLQKEPEKRFRSARELREMLLSVEEVSAASQSNQSDSVSDVIPEPSPDSYNSGKHVSIRASRAVKWCLVGSIIIAAALLILNAPACFKIQSQKNDRTAIDLRNAFPLVAVDDSSDLTEIIRKKPDHDERRLDLSSSRVKHLPKIVELKKLEQLDLKGSDITDEAIDNILLLNNLNHLSIKDTNISVSAFKKLAKLSKLKLIDVTGCKNIDDASVLQMMREMPGCSFGDRESQLLAAKCNTIVELKSKGRDKEANKLLSQCDAALVGRECEPQYAAFYQRLANFSDGALHILPDEQMSIAQVLNLVETHNLSDKDSLDFANLLTSRVTLYFRTDYKLRAFDEYNRRERENEKRGFAEFERYLQSFARRNANSLGHAVILCAYGTRRAQCGYISKGEELVRQSIAIFERGGGRRKLLWKEPYGIASLTLGNIEFGQGKLKQALADYANGEVLLRGSKNSEALRALFSVHLTVAKDGRINRSQASRHYHMAVDIANRLQDRSLIKEVEQVRLSAKMGKSTYEAETAQKLRSRLKEDIVSSRESMIIAGHLGGPLIIKFQNGHVAEAINQMKELSNLFELHNTSSLGHAMILTYHGGMLKQSGQTQSGARILQRSIDLYKSIGVGKNDLGSPEYALSLLNMADIERQAGSLKSAREKIQAALELLKGRSDSACPVMFINGLITLSQIDCAEGHEGGAMKNLNEALAEAKKYHLRAQHDLVIKEIETLKGKKEH